MAPGLRPRSALLCLVAAGYLLGCTAPEPTASGGRGDAVAGGGAERTSVARTRMPLVTPTLSPEFSIGRDAPSANPWPDRVPGVGFDGSNYFVAWAREDPDGSHIVGKRISTSGLVLDPDGLWIADGREAQVTFDGANYWVVFAIPDPSGSGKSQIYGKRVTPDGQVLDPQSLPLSAGPNAYDYGPRVTRCGVNVLVAWIGNGGSYEGVRVAPNGVIVDSPPLPLAPTTYASIGPAANGCLVAWLDSTHQVVAARYGSTGASLDPTPLSLGNGASSEAPSVLFDDVNQNSLTTWKWSTVGSATEVRAARISPGGVVLDTTPLSVTSAAPASGRPLGGAWDGSAYWVVWSQSGGTSFEDIYASRLDANGTRLDASDIVIAMANGLQLYPSAAGGGGGAFIAWLDGRVENLGWGTYDIFGARVRAGAVLDTDGTLLSTGTSVRDSVAVSSDGTSFFAAWRDSRGAQVSTYAARFAASGAVLDAEDVLVSAANDPPAVGFTGSEYLVAWPGSAARVTTAGALLDLAPLTLPGVGENTRRSVACARSGCLVTWQWQPGRSDDLGDIWAGIVGNDGTVSTFPEGDGGTTDHLAVSTATKTQEAPAAASDGTDFVVVWADCRDDLASDPAACSANIYGARVTADGDVLDDDDGAIRISASNRNDRAPAITYDAGSGQYLVVWKHTPQPGAVLPGEPPPVPDNGDIAGARLKVVAGPGGSLVVVDQVAHLVISDAPGEQGAPVVAYSGNGYDSLVAWEDVPEGSTAKNIHATWLRGDGTVPIPDGFAISSGATFQLGPVVASNGQGTILVAQSSTTIVNGSPRVASLAGRLVTALPGNGTPCSSDAPCASGLCRDGVCCNEDCGGICRRCDQTPGTCIDVADAEDADTCAGTSSCDGSGACKKKPAEACSGGDGTQCLSGFCSDGYCCNEPCGLDCDTCAEQPGVCTVLSKGSSGAECGPGYLCDGQAHSCATRCAADEDCAKDYFCSPQNACVPFCKVNSDCGGQGVCNTTTGQCVAGGRCDGDHTILALDGNPKNDKSCGAFRCSMEKNACLTGCTTSGDCVSGLQCDAQGRCTKPRAATSGQAGAGCSFAPHRRDHGPWPLVLALWFLSGVGRRWRGLLPLATLALLGCSDSRSSADRASSVPASAAAISAAPRGGVGLDFAGPSLDLSALRTRAHFAYRAEADGSFTGGHDAYATRVVARGAITFRSMASRARSPVLRLETRSIRRGSRVLASGAGKSERRADGTLVIHRGQVVEHLENNLQGTEQSYAFAEPPAGKGDLTVRIAATGVPYSGETNGALTFTDPSTGIGARYGSPTWVDAQGARTTVASRWEPGSRGGRRDSGGEIVLTVPSDVLRRSRFPAVIDPIISPELPLGDLQRRGVDNASSPAVAFDGTNYLIVFTDGNFAAPPGRGIFVAGDGKIVDPEGVALPGAPAGIAFGGGHYLVVWSEAGDVRGARVSVTGQLIDAQGFSVGSGSGPRVAYCGGSHVLVWVSTDGSIAAVHVDSSGAVVEAAPFQVSAAGYQPAIVGSTGQCLIVWNNANSVMGSRIGATGAPLDSPALAVSGATFTYDQTVLATDGTDFLVLWQKDGGYSGLLRARVSAAGVLLDDPPPLLTFGGTALDQRQPAMIWDGSRYLAIWTRPLVPYRSNLRGVHFTAQGDVVEADEIAISDNAHSQSKPALARGSSGSLLTWTETANVYASRVDDSGQLLDAPGVLISSAKGFQDQVSIASDGDGYLAVWHDLRGGQEDIYGARLTADGTPLDPAGIAIATSPTIEHSPTAAFDGAGYLVAWLEQPDVNAMNVRGNHVGSDGALRDVTPFEIDLVSKVQRRPLAVACAGAGCLVAWTERIGTSSDIGGAVVSGSSATHVSISTAPTDQMDPAIATNGTDYLVAWTDSRDATSHIYGARVAADGSVRDAAGVGISLADLAEKDVTLTYDPERSRYIAAWERAGDVQGARLTDDGSSLVIVDPAPGLTLAGADGQQTAAQLAYSGDGHDALVVWQEQQVGGSRDVYAAWLTEDGSLRDSGSVASGSWHEARPRVASAGMGTLLVTYELREPTAFGDPIGTLATRVVTSDALDGVACLADAQCASRKCRDGFCCHSECDTSCETCSAPASPGVCTCTGLSTCTGSQRVCTKNDGLPCAEGPECSNGHCVDGYCCESACTEACTSCNATPGVCTPMPKESLGRVEKQTDGTWISGCTAGYLCDGVSRDCPTVCGADHPCAPNYFCTSSSQCAKYCATNEDCAEGSRCDMKLGTCVSGATCSEASDHVLIDGSGTDVECAPYLCLRATQACGTECRSSADCVEGRQCNVNGECVEPAAARTRTSDAGCGCKLSPGGSSGPGRAWVPLVALALLASGAARRRHKKRATSARLGAWAFGLTSACAAQPGNGTLPFEAEAGTSGATDARVDDLAGEGGPRSREGGKWAQLGAQCTSAEECASGACVGGACTKKCQFSADCPDGPEWSCAREPGLGAICRCSATGIEACDGRDNDCNGQIDDGATCSGALRCKDAACTCPVERQCGPTCVDLDVNVTHCGTCDNECPRGAVCSAGQCECPGETTRCGDACLDLSADEAHCGACGVRCGALEECVSGGCVCVHATCGDECTSLDDDARHCGRCGHDCGGSECVDGQCQAVRIVEGDVTKLAVSQASLYYATTPAANVNKVRSAGLDGENQADLGDGDDLSGIVASDSFVYWANRFNFWRALRDGSAPVLTQKGSASSLALDSEHLYWTGEGTIGGVLRRGVFRSDLDFGNPILLAEDGGLLRGLLVVGSTAFWSSGAPNTPVKINRVNLDGSGLGTIASSSQVAVATVSALAVDPSSVYFVGYFGPAGSAPGIFHADWDGAHRSSLFHADARNLLVDATSLYWVNTNSYADGALYRAPLGGGMPRALATLLAEEFGNTPIMDVAQDEAFIYYCISGGKRAGLWKVAK